MQDSTSLGLSIDFAARPGDFALAALEGITDGFAAMDTGWRFVFINEPGLRILSPLGKTRGNMLGRVLWEEMPNVIGTVVEENYRRAMDERITVVFELFYEPIGRWLSVRAYPYSGGLAVYFLDIHERKEQENKVSKLSRQLKEQTEIFDTTLSHIDDFAYIFDRAGRFVFVNRPLLDLWGLKLAQAVGKSFHELPYPVELATRLQQEIQQVIATKAGVTNETSYTSPSGHEGYYEYIFQPVFAADGSVKLVAGSTRNITEHRRTEQALRASEDRLHTLVANLPGAAAFIVNRELRYVLAEGEALKQVGLVPGDLVGKTIFEALPAELAARYEPNYRGILAGETFSLEHASHGRFYITKGVPLRDSTGGIYAALVVSYDITQRRQTDELLRENQQRLEAALGEARAAADTKDRFIAMLSHELRTPLSPVLMLASDLAADASLPANIRAAFEIVRKNVELEARLIDDLLDLNGLAHEKIVLEPKRINLHDVVTDALENVSGDLKSKDLLVELRLEASQHHVRGDAVRLQQVLWNILRNAAKFTPAGGKVRVETQNKDGGKQIVARVTDSGIGMTAGELQRVFEAFAQGDHADTDGTGRFGGLGLGLAISRRLAEMHGGKIEASSAGPGHGATFALELSTDQQTPDRTLAVEPAARSGGQRAADNDAVGYRILVVEDHAPTRDALRALLSRRGHVVETASSAQEGLEKVSQKRFELVISDLGLPGMDGYLLMPALHRLQPSLVGIALSGFGMAGDLQRSSQAGFTAHLVKPIQIEQLDAAISQLVVVRVPA